MTNIRYRFLIPLSRKLVRRRVTENDVFSLYEWTDHMLSASNNGAANVVWRECILMHVFGKLYPYLTEEKANEYFTSTPKKQADGTCRGSGKSASQRPGNQPGKNGNSGSMFTGEAKKIIPGSGGSSASPYGLMKYLVALESGKIVDEASSLEIKRLLYMTATRIRYASSWSLTDAGVYFKSGSLYQCRTEEGYQVRKIHGQCD